MISLELISILVSIGTLMVLILRFLLSMKYRRPQAELVIKQKEEILNQQLFNHRQELKKWFFQRIKEDLVGIGTLNENAVFDRVEDLIEILNKISKSPDIEEHWKNGMKHLNNDDKCLYNLLNAIEGDMMELNKGTDQLNRLMEEKVNEMIKSNQSVDRFNDLSAGKIMKKTLLILIKNELTGFLTRCSWEKGDIINCLKKQNSSDLIVNAKGYITKDNTSFAMPSPDLNRGDVESIIHNVEKDDELLKEMIKIRDRRIKLRDKLVNIRDRCTILIEKIDKGTYYTVVDCCPK